MGAINGNDLNFGSQNAIVRAMDTALLPSVESHREVTGEEVDPTTYAIHTKDAGGSILLLSSINAKSQEIAEALRSVRSEIDKLREQASHEFEVLWNGDQYGDITLPPNVSTWLTEWIDIRKYALIAYIIRNTGGVNNITGEISSFSIDLPGTILANNGSATAIAPGGMYYSQQGTIVAGNWGYTTNSPLVAAGLRIAAASTVGTTGRGYVVGKR